MLKSVSAHNFPVQLTSFVGRAAQLIEMRKLLADNWLDDAGAGGAASRSWQFSHRWHRRRVPRGLWYRPDA
jgi:hypothetical protein